MSFSCSCSHQVRLIVALDGYSDGYEPGTTIWSHGTGEAAMVVTPEMRAQWGAEGKSAVGEMFQWIDRVHEYERGRPR